MNTIDEYIAQFADNETVCDRLKTIRRIVQTAAPEAKEKISWQMPTFTLGKILIQFAAFKQHISLFPGPQAIEALSTELKLYSVSKGTVQLQNNEPLPEDLIRRIVEFKIGILKG